jgi:predicted nucleotide-binding protein
MDYDEHYQDGKNGPLKKEIRDRISAFRTRGSTLADIGAAIGFSGPFVSQLLNEKRPGRVRSIHVARIIKALEKAEREHLQETSAETRVAATPLRQQHPVKALLQGAVRPKVFIASSLENLSVAYAVQEELEHDVEPTVWRQGVFALSRTAMESLIRQLRKSDFGVFILSPDDVAEIRSTSKRIVRDNVIFELGLFIGFLGPERCFLVVPRGIEDLQLPSDIFGLMPATFDPARQDKNMQASLGPACNRIRRAVAELGPFPDPRAGSHL